MQALTFQELAELWFLLQPGLEIEELPVATVDSVVSHLLEAACILTLQGCLILGERQQSVILRAPKTTLMSSGPCWPHSPQTPGRSHLAAPQIDPSLKNSGCTAYKPLVMTGTLKTENKRLNQLHTNLGHKWEPLSCTPTAAVPDIPPLPGKIHCRATHQASPHLQTPAHAPPAGQGS